MPTHRMQVTYTMPCEKKVMLEAATVAALDIFVRQAAEPRGIMTRYLNDFGHEDRSLLDDGEAEAIVEAYLKARGIKLDEPPRPA